MYQQKQRDMTLRVKYDDLFKTWKVEYYNEMTEQWNVCTDYYPKTNRRYASFASEKEANEFMYWKYEKTMKSEQDFKNMTFNYVPANYYGQNRYYGD